jgi:hypothetical protein
VDYLAWSSPLQSSCFFPELVYPYLKNSLSSNSLSIPMLPIKFPLLRSVLWDQTSLGDTVLVSSSICVPSAVTVRTSVLQSLLHRGKKTSLVFGKLTRQEKQSASSLGGDYSLEFDAFDAGNDAALPRPSDESLSLRALRPFHIKVSHIYLWVRFTCHSKKTQWYY